MRETKTPIPHKHIGVAVIWNDRRDRILVDRRPPEGLLGGLWEFPGGKIEAGETPEACVKREILEELAIEIEVGQHLITVDHAYSHFKVSLHVYHCTHRSGEPQPIACDEIRWVTVAELSELPFPAANVKIIDAIVADSANSGKSDT
jgi:A/G-specific adenine glycosylase